MAFSYTLYTALLITFLSSLIETNAAGDATIHMWAIRHVRSTHNDKKNPPEPPNPPQGTSSAKQWRKWDQPPSEAGGEQLIKIYNKFAKMAMQEDILRQELKQSDLIQFRSSDLCRAQITSMVARESLLEGVEKNKQWNATLEKINAEPFVVSQYLRERYDGDHQDGFSRFRQEWRNEQFSASMQDYHRYLNASLPQSFKTAKGSVDDMLLRDITMQYEGKKENNEQVPFWWRNIGGKNYWLKKRLISFGSELKRELEDLAAKKEKDDSKNGVKTIIAGVHGSWLSKFIRKYGTQSVVTKYQQVCKAIGKKRWQFFNSYRLGNGQLLDLEIKLIEGKGVQIVDLAGYNLAHSKVKQPGRLYDRSQRVDLSAFSAVYEQFGDEYLYMDSDEYQSANSNGLDYNVELFAVMLTVVDIVFFTMCTGCLCLCGIGIYHYAKHKSKTMYTEIESNDIENDDDVSVVM